MSESENPTETHTERIATLESKVIALRAQNQALREDLKAQIKNYNKTGRRLVVLGVLLEVLLGAVTIPLAFAVYSGMHAFVEDGPGGLVLPGVFVGIGIAVAGVFYAAAKMLDAIPAILAARNDNAKKILEALQAILTAPRQETGADMTGASTLPIGSVS